LFKGTLEDIIPVAKQFAANPVENIVACQRRSVIHIGRCQNKVKELALVIDDKVELTTIEPVNAELYIG
jgi:hypothetical protein